MLMASVTLIVSTNGELACIFIRDTDDLEYAYAATLGSNQVAEGDEVLTKVRAENIILALMCNGPLQITNNTVESIEYKVTPAQPVSLCNRCLKVDRLGGPCVCKYFTHPGGDA